ncbi:MAG: hypothetical protein KME35_07660 [Aphanocapsa sp. GSE-SYN-MK-11-07L]|nr:hypothetical protein [Aphanocapsa sp. GSE-SYN-MK-11-07L]
MNKKLEPDKAELSQNIASVLEELATYPREQLLPSLDEVFFQWLKPDQWMDVGGFISGKA